MQWILVLALAGASIALDARAADLTLAQAQKQAVQRSRQLQGIDASIASSLAMAQAASQLPDPVLKAGIDNIPAEGGDKFSLTRDAMTMRRVGIAQEWTRQEKRDARRERYEREADRARAERRAGIAEIEREAALAWLERYYDEAMAAEARRFVEASGAEVQAAEAEYRAGKGGQATVFANRSALAMAEDKRLDFERRARSARVTLARWTGGSGSEPLAEPPDMASVHLENTDLRDHLTQHPEIVALQRQAEVAEAEARVAASAKRPDWTFEAAFQQRASAYGNMVSIGVSIPLPWDAANRQDRETASKLSMAEEARAKRDEMLRGHVAEVESMLDEWRAGRERQVRFRRDVVGSALERTRAAVSAFAGNKASLDEVMGARRAEFEARLQALQLDLEVARLWARLEFLLPVDIGGEGSK